MTRPALVTLHGLGLSARSFAPMLEHVRTPFDVVGIDLPGFGEARDERWTTVDALRGALVDRIAQEVGERDWMLVGHSVGGRLATLVAASLRDASGRMPRAMALLAPSPPTREPMPAAKRAEMLGWARSGRIDAEAARAFVDANVGAPLDEALDRATVAGVAASDPASWIAWLESGSREDWSEEAGVVDVPLVVVAGEADDALGAAAQPGLHGATYPRARWCALPGTGHLVALERPAETAAAIDERWRDA
ncbi:alpha/beta hydrolase [Agrococcus versicolor]|uniref:Alpha/beta hydrolase n=1 Tax=Agrococcus versicolor TaxID=501482 RepID=A0ABN3AII0_9MICO